MRYQSYNNRGNYFWLIMMLILIFGGARFFMLFLGIVFLLFPLLIFIFVLFTLFNIINKNSHIYTYTSTQTPEHNKFVELLARISAHLMNADGKVEPIEIQTFKNFFVTRLGFSNNALLLVEDLLKKELKKEHNLNELADEINHQFNYDLKCVMLDLLYQIAYCDFELHDTEEKMLHEIASLLQISYEDVNFIIRRYQRASSGVASSEEEDRYFRILGLQRGATQEEIRDTYRILVKKFHPDVVSHLGEEFKKANETKLKEITEAYQKLKK